MLKTSIQNNSTVSAVCQNANLTLVTCATDALSIAVLVIFLSWKQVLVGFFCMCILCSQVLATSCHCLMLSDFAHMQGKLRVTVSPKFILQSCLLRASSWRIRSGLRCDPLTNFVMSIFRWSFADRYAADYNVCYACAVPA